jgi:hypothetical protein
MGNSTSTPEASRWRRVGAIGSSSGAIVAMPPVSTASEASASIQQPSWAMPSGVT